MSDKSCCIQFLGDVYLPNKYESNIHLNNFIFNMEYPLTNSMNAAPMKINLKAAENNILNTFGINPVAVCLSNNHIFDYGEKGLVDTISELDKMEIEYFGIHNENNNINRCKILDFEGKKIAIIGFVCNSTTPIYSSGDYTIASIEPSIISEDIKSAKDKGADRIIINLHWGAEEVFVPKPQDIRIARHIIDLGADLIIGHHAHCTQSYEYYKGKYIFYGLGNCIFPDLNVSSMYERCDGKPQRVYIKKQRYWNKKSILVQYDLATENVCVKRIIFDGEKLTYRHKYLSFLNTFNPRKKILRISNRKYLYIKSLCMLRIMIHKFIDDPKKIRLRHLRAAITGFSRRNV